MRRNRYNIHVLDSRMTIADHSDSFPRVEIRVQSHVVFLLILGSHLEPQHFNRLKVNQKLYEIQQNYGSYSLPNMGETSTRTHSVEAVALTPTGAQ